MTEEDIDDLKDCVKHSGFKQILILVDDIVSTIKGNVLSVPLDKDPEKTALVLLQERMKLEGAVALRTALLHKVESIKRSAK